MFSSLSDKLLQSLKVIRGQAKITESNIQEVLAEIRVTFLEADVALSVADAFIDRVKERALGREVSVSLNPGQAFVKIVQQELVHTMGDADVRLNFKQQPPVVIMLPNLHRLQQ